MIDYNFAMFRNGIQKIFDARKNKGGERIPSSFVIGQVAINQVQESP